MGDDSEVILLNFIQCIRASSRIRRLSLQQLDLPPLLLAIKLLSGNATGMRLPCVVLGTLSSVSATESSLSLKNVMESLQYISTASHQARYVSHLPRVYRSYEH